MLVFYRDECTRIVSVYVCNVFLKKKLGHFASLSYNFESTSPFFYMLDRRCHQLVLEFFLFLNFN